jgi:hypothetical protein
MESQLTRYFTKRDRAMQYAYEIERGHDVEVRWIDVGSGVERYVVFVDADTCYPDGHRLYTNLLN